VAHLGSETRCRNELVSATNGVTITNEGKFAMVRMNMLCMYYLYSFSIVFHLTDVLHHCGCPDGDTPHMTSFLHTSPSDVNTSHTVQNDS
jgi:hypothetical protein